MFDAYSYTSSPIRVDLKKQNHFITFEIFDTDTQSFDVNQFTVTTNDQNFYITNDGGSIFYLNFEGKLSYYTNNEHIYYVTLTATDNGVPSRSTNATVQIPLINYNVNPPTYTAPVIINVATDYYFHSNPIFSQLNAYDIDGDNVQYSLDPKTPTYISSVIQVNTNGSLLLKQSIATIQKSTISFNVILNDDCACCDCSTYFSSSMKVQINIVDVNLYSPEFIANSDGINYCETIYQVSENELFQIELMARDKDTRLGGNDDITIMSPYVDGSVPQNSFGLNTAFSQTGTSRKAVVYNLITFDYEKPMYGSNTMYLMYSAEDAGKPHRFGYCFMSIQITDVNDNPPMFSQNNFNIYISKGSYELNKWTYRFIATDADSGDNAIVQYKFNSGTNASVTRTFKLSSDGIIEIADYSFFVDSKEPFSFTIVAYNPNNISMSATASVTIIKTPSQILPPFFINFPSNNTLPNTISELTPRGTVIGSFGLLMQSNWTNQFLRCYLSPKPSPEWFIFKFQTNASELRQKEACNLIVEEQLNYNSAQSIVLFMVAELGSSQEATTTREFKTLKINLAEENTNPPKFPFSKLQSSCVEGKSDIGRVVAVAKAYDLDRNPPFNTITYSLVNPSAYFKINQRTGEITLKGEIRGVRIVNLEVQATDGAPADGNPNNLPNSNTIYVNIRVIDINDNPPIFTAVQYQFSVAENVQPGYVIGTVDATDVDTETSFNFSISDPTFGVRPFYNQSLASSLINYKGSAHIYLNKYLDYFKQSTYTLTIKVSDSTYEASSTIVINVINVNDRPPVFQSSTNFQVFLMEKSVGSITVLSATDPDGLIASNQLVYNIYTTPYLNVAWFNLDQSGNLQVTLPRLDRDAPYGAPVQYLPISVSDGLTTYSSIQLTLADINDHAPQPQFIDSTKGQLIISEGIASAYVDLFFIDVDDPIAGNGPPFTVNLNSYTNLFLLSAVTCTPNELCTNRLKYRLQTKQALNRTIQKYYLLNYIASDKGGMSTNGVLQVIVAPNTNQPQSDGSKLIEVVFLQNQIPANSYLGTLFVNDANDWSLSTKTAQCQSNVVTIGQSLKIYGPNHTDTQISSSLKLTCSVTSSQLPTSTATVSFTTDNVQYIDLTNVGFVRLQGQSAEDLVFKSSIGQTSKLDTLKTTLLSMLQADSIQIITLRNYTITDLRTIPNAIPLYDITKFGCDVYFYAIKSNRYITTSKAYALINNQLSLLSNLNGILVTDVCSLKTSNYCPIGSTCKQNYVYSAQKLTADGNATAFVGIDGLMNTECYCDVAASMPKVCFNGGTLGTSSSGNLYYCDCPAGFDGPQCELTAITFSFDPSSTKHSYALFDSFKLCDYLRVELEFVMDRQRGLLFFNGPINREALYFIAVEVVNGLVIAHVGNNTITIPNVNVSDGLWHRLDISIALNTVQVNIDKYASITSTIPNINDLKTDLAQSNDITKLSIGGVPPSISGRHFYFSTLSVFEYEGCIQNVKINGQVKNMNLDGVDYNLAQSGCNCKYVHNSSISCIVKNSVVARAEFPWWIILITIITVSLNK